MKRTPASLTVEQRLLAACIGPDEAALAAALRACLAAGDWSAFVCGAVRHGAVQVAADRLARRPEWDALPDRIRVALDRTVQANRRRNDVLFAELGRVVRALDAAGIPSLLLKGPALALAAYPDPALRHFGDLDLLVSARDLERAGAALEACGFAAERALESGRHEWTFARPYAEDLLSGALAPEYDPAMQPEDVARAGRRVVVELHRGLFKDAAGTMRETDLAAFWRGAPTAHLPDGTPAHIPPPEAFLAHLCAHASDHGYGRLMFLVDVRLAVEAWGAALDWEQAAATAAQIGAAGPAWRLLDLALRAAGASVPGEALARLSAGCPSARPLEIADVFALEAMPRGSLAWRRWRESESAAERLAGIAHLIAPGPAAMRRLYGEPLPAPLPLLYLWRPLQLAGRAVRAVVAPARRPANRATPS